LSRFHWSCWTLPNCSCFAQMFLMLPKTILKFSSWPKFVEGCWNYHMIPPDDIKLSTTFTFKWKLKKHLLHETNSQLWTLATFHLSNKLLWFLVSCNSVLLYVCIYFFVFSVCTFYAFRHEVHLLFFFSILPCFLSYLTNKFL